MTDPILRHAGSNIPGRVSPGNEQMAAKRAEKRERAT